MLVFRTVSETVKRKKLDHVKCDGCSAIIGPDDFIGMQEMLSIRFTGGYGSIFGDGALVEADLCQYCVKTHLGAYLRVVEEEEDEDICNS